MKKTLLVFKTILKATLFKRKIHKYQYDGNKFNIEVSHAWRWYNPVFIIFSAIAIPFYILSGGLGEWMDDIATGCSFEDNLIVELKGEFKTNSHSILRKFDLWQVTYRCA